MMRMIRAFLRALVLTLRGESFTPIQFRPLEAWIEVSLRQLDELIKEADKQGIDLAQRQAMQLKLDGRMTSLELSLQMLRHNLVNEYPRLIRQDDPFSMTVVLSINMNDQYRVGQFAASEAMATMQLKPLLVALDAHLQNLPSIQIEQ